MNRMFCRLALSLVLLVSTASAMAGEGRHPIWEPVVLGPGDEGRYILTQDVHNPSGPAIQINAGAGDIDIDLNGFTVSGLNHVIWAQDISRLTVRNGSVVGGTGDGIRVLTARKVVVEDVKLVDNPWSGIGLFRVASFAIRRNIVQGSELFDGILVDNSGADTAGQGVIDDNLIEDCSAGLTVTGDNAAVAVTRNRILRTTGYQGLRAKEGRGFLIAENSVRGAATDGIELHLLDDSLVLSNVSGGNGASGIRCRDADRNHLEGNVTGANGAAGIFLDEGSVDNTYGRNTGRGNLSAPGTCINAGSSCAGPDLCDDGTNNSTFNDNMLPGSC